MNEELVCLECPSCKNEICQPLKWFKQAYGTCPTCHAGVTEGQFASVVAALEEAMEEEIAQMIGGKPGDKPGCGGACGGGRCR